MITGVIKNQARGRIWIVFLPCIVEKYLAEETGRFRLTVENYTRACKAAEDGEYEMPEDGEAEW